MKSILEMHLEYVAELKARGETVLQPKLGKPMCSVQGYIKTQIPHKDAGAIFKVKDGSYGLHVDMGLNSVTGIMWKDLGLCDSRCWYEWMNTESYQGERNDMIEFCEGLISEYQVGDITGLKSLISNGTIEMKMRKSIIPPKQERYDELMQYIGRIEGIILLLDDLEGIDYDAISGREYRELISQPTFLISEAKSILKEYAKRLR